MWFQKSSVEVICIGSASQDIFFPTDEGLVIDTPEDITSKQKLAFELGGKIRIKDRYEAVGGVAVNVALGLTQLGHHAATYSCIGTDALGTWVYQELKESGISLSFTKRLDRNKTDLSCIIVDKKSGERTIFHNRDASNHLAVESTELARAHSVFVSALNGDWQKNLATILQAKKEYGFLLAFNPGQHNIKADTRLIFDALASVDILLLNKDEAIELLASWVPRPSDEDLDNEFFLLKNLHQAGARLIGMTDGKRGAWAYDGKTCFSSAIVDLGPVIDSTGAGDAFSAAFFSACLQGLPIKEALRYGIINSASVVTEYGAGAALLSREELPQFLERSIPCEVTE